MQRELERRERIAHIELAQGVIPTRQRHGQRSAVVSAPRRGNPLAAAVAVSGLLFIAALLLAPLFK